MSRLTPARLAASLISTGRSFQVNHLAPFLLTMLLLGPLSAGQACVITTSSSAGTARDAVVKVDDLDMADSYDGLRAYKASKLANVLFTRELARRWGHLGISTAAGPVALGPLGAAGRASGHGLAAAAGHAVTREGRYGTSPPHSAAFSRSPQPVFVPLSRLDGTAWPFFSALNS
jgi:NAD(P)-dependent dehydrogenase (short-subunit alcohol dehydrogenase family)